MGEENTRAANGDLYIEKKGQEKTNKKKLVKNKLRTPQKRIYNEQRILCTDVSKARGGGRACPFSFAFHLQRARTIHEGEKRRTKSERYVSAEVRGDEGVGW